MTSKKELLANAAERSGHSRHLRQILKARRTDLGLSARDVTDRIAELLTKQDREYDADAPRHRPKHSNTLYLWERFENHPSISDFAAWAKVLGFRLVVELMDRAAESVVVHLRNQDAVEIARIADRCTDEQRQALLLLARSLAPADPS